MRRTRGEASESEPSPRRSRDWVKEVHSQQGNGCIIQYNSLAKGVSCGAIFKGLMVPVLVPFENGAVNPTLIEDRYATELQMDGVESVLVGFGVYPNISLEERKTVLRAWSKSKLRVCVDVSCPIFAEMAEMVKFASRCSVAALCISFDAQLESEAVIANVSKVTELSEVPVFYRHTSKRFLASEVVTLLLKRGAHIRGAIEDGNGADVSSLIGLTNETFTDVVGQEGVISALTLGCTGVIVSCGNFAAPLFNRLVAACTKGDRATCSKLYSCLNQHLQDVHGNVEKLRCLTGLRLECDMGAHMLEGRLSVGEVSRLQSKLEMFVAAYSTMVQEKPKDSINIKVLPGFKGLLNNKIRDRIFFLEKAIGVPITHKFPHLFPGGKDPSGTLAESDMSWRIPVNEALINPARFIDHTILKADATEKDVNKLCQEAKENNFYAVCVNGSRVSQCVKLLRGTGVQVAAVIGFPLGAGTIEAKAAEAGDVVAKGATEVDMVINVGALKDKNYRYVFDDIAEICRAVVNGGKGTKLKVIFETCLLSDEEVLDCAVLSVAAGAHFVKTSTGFSTGGALPKDIDVMLATVGNQAEVKASGGVREREPAMAYISAGVMRIGTSSGVAIVNKTKSAGGY